MPTFTPPRLDDRDWDALRRELVRRIPVHAPTWTDHNASDPGIALIEVFAWLAENLLRRMDRVPEASRLEFLGLLGLPLRSAAVAEALLRVDLPKGVILPRILELSAVVPRAQLSAGKVRFQAAGEIQVLPVAAWPAIKRRDPDYVSDPDFESRVKDTLRENLGRSVDLAPYLAEPLPPPVNGKLPAPFVLDAAMDASLWVALLAPEGYELGKKDDEAQAARRALADRLAGTVLNLGVWVDETLRGALFTAPRPGEPQVPVDLRVDLPGGPFDDTTMSLDKVRFARVPIVEDGTCGLDRSGVIRVQLPATGAQIDTWRITDELGRSCDGMGDLPPAVDDDKLARRVITWLRLRRPGQRAPWLCWVDVNTLRVEAAVTARPEVLGQGTGAAGQSVKTSRSPVIADSLVVEVREADNQWVRWHEVPTLALSGADDPHYTLDAATGTLLFGDGRLGRMPQIGEAVRARTYRWGGGAAGNVPPGAISKIIEPGSASDLKITQLLPATGGEDAETVPLATARIPKVLRHNDRAVAMEDFEDLARETPGAGVGRVMVLPRHFPPGHLSEVPGVVTLVVLPSYDPLHPDEPVPDRTLLRRVCEWLEPRRLCTTELYLIPPTYVRIQASVGIELQEGYGLQTVKRWVELAIRQYFAPLPPYGPAGEGWPKGRTVRDVDIAAAALAVDGVRVVTGVLLASDALVKDPKNLCDPGQVPIEDWQLPSIVSVGVAAGEPEAILPPDPAPATSSGYAVPLVRELC